MVLAKISPIRSIGSVWRRIRIIWVGMNLGQNSVMPQFGRGVAEDLETQNLHLFKPIDRKSKVVKHIKNQCPKSNRRGDMEIYLLFDLKKCCSSAILPPNWARKLIYLLGSLLFSPISPPRSLKKCCFFWLFFLIFSVRSSHISPLNWALNWN